MTTLYKQLGNFYPAVCICRPVGLALCRHYQTDAKSMQDKHFFFQLFILSALVALGLYFLNQLPQLQADAPLSWISLVGFIGLSVFMYYTGKRSAKSENKNDFTNVVLGFTIG